MSTTSQISDAFEDLSHGLRVLMEAHIRAHHEGLLNIDRAEAVGNIEVALAAVLNAFHSLYDALEKEGYANLINWYETPELATVLILRNARHHNQANKVRTIYTLYIQETKQIGNIEMYVLIDFPPGEEDADTFDVYLSWADFRSLLSMSPQQSRIREPVARSIHNYLGSSKFVNYANRYRFGEERIFFNVVPLFVNAAVKIVPVIKHLVCTRSLESETALDLFQHLPPVQMNKPEINCSPITLKN